MYSIIYIMSAVLINLSFTYIQPFTLPNGDIWSIGSLLAGAIFVFRDFAQREVGHIKVLGLMCIAGAISYVMASPFIAVVSLVSFAVSEIMDYIIFTTHKGSFRSRIIKSSLISVPVDTIIFLTAINHLSTISFIIMISSKLVCLYFVARMQEERQNAL